MRRLTQHDRDDHGVGTILLVLAMAAILFGAGFAIDVTRFSQENSSAQHSADATALAVATDCVLSSAHVPQAAGNYDVYRKVPDQVISATTPINSSSCSTGKVTITVEKNVDKGMFLNRDAGSVHKTAEVQWGTLGTATTIPITISSCEFSQALLDGTTDIILYLDDAKPQSGCSSLPGGFSQLVNNNCAVTVSAAGTVPGDPGGDLNKQVDCITNPTAPKLPHDVLIPMYDAAACAGTCKGHGPYPILGFAAFHVTGYSFN